LEQQEAPILEVAEVVLVMQHPIQAVLQAVQELSLFLILAHNVAQAEHIQHLAAIASILLLAVQLIQLKRRFTWDILQK
jgi:hypothetical protein